MASLSQRAYDHIRGKLLRGGLLELSETKLVGELGISRTPIREAIRRLESEGLVDQVPRRGTYVRRPNRHDLEELYQIRLLLEPFAAGAAAERINDQTVEQLAAANEQMRDRFQHFDPQLQEHWPQLIAEYAAADLQFHETLISATGNLRLLKIISDAQVLRQALGHPSDAPDEILTNLPEANAEHEAIFNAVAGGDAPGASAAMEQHIIRGRTRALKYFDWLERTSSEYLVDPRNGS